MTRALEPCLGDVEPVVGEAPSVLEPYVPAHGARPHGWRVVDGQRTIQAASDVFLGC
jgi:hypothetical protein